MKDYRVKKAKLNITTALISQLMSIICGLILPRLMLGAFGSESYGAVSSITQFLAYITLLEGGIGGVARAALYKPLAQNDMETIDAIMGEVRRFFRVLAWIFAVYVLILACGFQHISHITCMDWLSTFILVITISISNFGQYFIGASYSIFLQAAQKTYITNMVSIGTTVINTISTIVLIQLDCSLIFVKLASSFIFFMRPIILLLYVRKNYSLGKGRITKAQSYLTQKWTGLGQHIAYFLHSNTDIAILTFFSNLQIVAVYSIYNMIVTHVQGLAISLTSGMESVFGDMLAREEQRQLHETFRAYETLISVVSTVLFSTTAILIIPFIELYTEGIIDTNYREPIFAIVMILSALSYCLRMPYHALVIAAGHFRQTSFAAYGEAIINIVCSAVLVSEYGLIGVAFATLCAIWFRFLYYVIYLSKNIFYRKIRLFIKRIVINFLALLCSSLLGLDIVAHLELTNYLLWARCGVWTVIIVTIVTVGWNLLFFREDCHIFFRKFVR